MVTAPAADQQWREQHLVGADEHHGRKYTDAVERLSDCPSHGDGILCLTGLEPSEELTDVRPQIGKGRVRGVIVQGANHNIHVLGPSGPVETDRFADAAAQTVSQMGLADMA